MEHILILFFSFFIESMITWLYTGNLFSFQTFCPLTGSDAWYLIFSPVFVFFIAAAVSESAPFCVANILFLFIQFKLTLPLAFFHALILTAIMAMSELALLVSL